MREGAVGLLVLASVSAFVALVVWLRGVAIGRDSYRIRVEFVSAAGIDVGTPVNYRGVPVGQIESLEPGSNFVSVVARISPATLRIPKNVAVEVDQTGLIGEASLSIMPTGQIAGVDNLPLPTSKDCKNAVQIICDGDRLPGNPPINYGSMIRAMVNVSELITSSTFQEQMGNTVDNFNATANEIRALSRSGTSLAKSFERELGTFGRAARSLNATSDTVRTIAQSSAGDITATARSIRGASAQTESTLKTLNGLLISNRGTLTATLHSIARTSQSLRGVFVEVAPLLRTLNSSEAVANLDELIANTAATMANIRQLTGTVSDPSLILDLHETLRSARGVLLNVEKITADLESLTGDEAFRESLRKIVTALGELLSSVEQLDREVVAAKHEAFEREAAAIAARPLPPRRRSTDVAPVGDR